MYYLSVIGTAKVRWMSLCFVLVGSMVVGRTNAHMFNRQPHFVTENLRFGVSSDRLRASIGGKYFAIVRSTSFHWPGEIEIRSSEEGRVLTRLRGHSKSIDDLVFVNKDSTLITCGEDNTIRYWNVGDGRMVRTIDEKKWVTALAISSDGRLLACGFIDGQIEIRNTGTGALILRFANHQEIVRSIHFANKDQWIISSSNESIAVWDTANGNLRASFRPQRGVFTALTIASKNGRLYAGNNRGDIFICDLGTAKLLRTISMPLRRIESLAVDDSRNTVAIGCDDGSVRILRSPHSSTLATLIKLNEPIRDIFFSGSNQLIVGTHQFVTVYDMSRTAAGSKA